VILARFEDRVNIQKSIAFLYTSNEQVKLEIKNNNIFYISTPKRDVHRYKSNKYVQDLYEENYKTLMNEISEELNKWRDIPCP